MGTAVCAQFTKPRWHRQRTPTLVPGLVSSRLKNHGNRQRTLKELERIRNVASYLVVSFFRSFFSEFYNVLNFITTVTSEIVLMEHVCRDDGY